jgi:D-alanyl-D-alanine carboxypeptidase
MSFQFSGWTSTPAIELEYRVVSRQAFSSSLAHFRRVYVAVLLGFAILLPATGPAIASLREYAGIVVDAKNGEVMYSHKSDEARYPASVTKVMTLYVLFQELAAGNLTLNTKMTVSRHAASAVPTKLGLRAGAEITVENAIKALVTLSANDMARVIAEHISGSEEAFARRMTATARALGMNHTTYRNASGLPNTEQRTTVRDQAILAIAVYQHFPNYYEFFQTRSFQYNGRNYGNHNRLLGNDGVDGIKTGYINASGYNLMTAARANNRHIVVIAFGFNTSGSRDSKVRELVREYLPDARRGDYLRAALVPQPGRLNSGIQVANAAPVYVEPMPTPAFRVAELAQVQAASPGLVIPIIDPPADLVIEPQQVVPETVVASAPLPQSPPADLSQSSAVQAANILGGGNNASAPLTDDEVIGAFTSGSYVLGAPPSALGSTLPSAPLLPPVNVGGQGLDPQTSGSVAGTAPQQVAAVEPTASEGWVVQIGAAPNEVSAQTLLSDAASRVTGLADYRPYVERFDKDGQTFFRARFVGFAGRDAANSMCNALKAADLSCLALQS